MSTQKTRVDGPNDNEPTDEMEELDEILSEDGDEFADDLGIPDEQLAEDPTGYVPPTSVEEHGGRKMRRMTSKHIQEAHERYAGPRVRITGERVNEDPAMPDEVIAKQERKRDPRTEAQARDLLPEAFQQAQTKRRYEEKEEAVPELQSPEKYIDARKRADEAANVYEYLSQSELEAIDSGDFQAAAYTRSLKSTIENDFDVEEKVDRKERHPILQKFLANLGVERIRPVTQKWGGFKWHFYPIPPIVDRWINSTLESALNSAAVDLAASTVGLDGAPMYEVLNVPIRKQHKITPKDNNAVSTEVTVFLYKKHCDCGNDIPADAEKCERCGALHDKFDMPPALRIECAQRFYALLEHKFGPYEELVELVKIKDDKMKSRRFDKEDLYSPFLPWLKKEPSSHSKTTKSNSGEE